MPNIGATEIIIVLVIVLVIFGPKRLPQLGRSLGRGMREFKDSVTGKNKDDELEESASSAKVDASADEPERESRAAAKPAGDATS